MGIVALFLVVAALVLAWEGSQGVPPIPGGEGATGAVQGLTSVFRVWREPRL